MAPCLLWAIQLLLDTSYTFHPALDTTMLWNRICVVVLSVVVDSRAIPLRWQTLEQPTSSVSVSVLIALLKKADQLLGGFRAITRLFDRAFPCDELLTCFCGRSRWCNVIRLPGDTEIHEAAAHLGCQVLHAETRANLAFVTREFSSQWQKGVFERETITMLG